MSQANESDPPGIIRINPKMNDRPRVTEHQLPDETTWNKVLLDEQALAKKPSMNVPMCTTVQIKSKIAHNDMHCMNKAEDPSNEPEYEKSTEPVVDNIKKDLITEKIIKINQDMISNNKNTTEIHEDEKGELMKPKIPVTMSHNTMDTSTKIRGDSQDEKASTESMIMNFQEHLKGVKFKTMNEALLFENT